MIFYLLIFGVLLALAIMSEARLSQNSRKVLVVLCYITIVIVVGLRWETGNDWIPYHDYYQSLSQLSDKAQDFEVGYRAVSLAIKDASIPYWGFLLIYSAIYLGIMVQGFKEEEYRRTPWLVLLLYSSFLLGWMGTARQVMAIAMCLVATNYIVRRKPILFVLWVTIATLFHTTALCFLIAWPISSLKLRRSHTFVIIGLLTLFAVAGGGQLLVRTAGNLLHIPYLDAKLAFYEAISNDDLQLSAGNLVILWYAKRLVSLVVFTAFLSRLEARKERAYFNLYLFSLVLFLVFASVLPMIPLRAGLYFSVFELFLFVSLMDKFEAPWMRSVYKLLVVLIALSRLYSAVYLYHPDLFIPYKGMFINEDFIRSMY